MAAKRALIVDDSASARAFLARILRRFELDVDTAESAEQAIEYLINQRPDVIFMDHQMPGMDGFQAVQAIKSDPRTALIPILMFTSREGELYMSQARALGAVGVLPKQTMRSDVARVLEQLRLIAPSSGAEAGSTGTPAAAIPVLTPQSPAESARGMNDARVYALVEPMLDDQLREVRRLVHEELTRLGERIAGDMRQIVHDSHVPPPRSLPGWAVAVGTGLLIAIGFLWSNAVREARTLEQQLSATREQLATAQQNLAASTALIAATPTRPTDGAPAPATSPPPAHPVEAVATQPSPTGLQVEPVPFGEPPLALGRIERIQALIERLLSQDMHGTVHVRAFMGRYCMTGAEEPALTPPAESFARCGALGNPFEAAPASSRESPAFAAMIAGLRRRAAGVLTIQVSDGDAEDTVADYPPVTERLTAGEWNRAATANNRVEVRWRATSGN